MSRSVFNSIIIVICLLAIVTIAVILPHEYRRTVKRFHIVVQVIATILALSLLIFMLLTLDYTGSPSVIGEVVEIRTVGSFAGIYDRYKIILMDSNGITHEFQSIFPVYGHSSDIVSEIEIGDKCEVYGSTLIDAFFYSLNLPK